MNVGGLVCKSKGRLLGGAFSANSRHQANAPDPPGPKLSKHDRLQEVQNHDQHGFPFLFSVSLSTREEQVPEVQGSGRKVCVGRLGEEPGEEGKFQEFPGRQNPTG